MKLVALSAVPLGVVMWTGPVVAPVGTVAVIWVAESTVNVVAAVVSNVTPVVPQKFVPVITTVAPTVPLAGTKDVSDAAAAGATEKFVTLAVSFTGVVTRSLPVTAPTGTRSPAWLSLPASVCAPTHGILWRQLGRQYHRRIADSFIRHRPAEADRGCPRPVVSLRRRPLLSGSPRASDDATQFAEVG